MNTIIVRNVNDAFREGAWALRSMGIVEESRNGPVKVMPGPFMTVYKNPTERVLFNDARDANHVFHLVEAIWMLAGRSDADFLVPYNSNYITYSEPDGHVHGAYGHRWRNNWSEDQIVAVVRELESNPTSRRAVIAMWDPYRMDMGSWNDTPCNTHIYFDLRGGVLNMTVCNRSNDMVWGAYGANVVHMSMLQELIASVLGVEVGEYRQFSNNFHLYTERHGAFLENPPELKDLYSEGRVMSYPILGPGESLQGFLGACERWCQNGSTGDSEFIDIIVDPLAKAYRNRKSGLPFDRELAVVPNDCDWKVAFEEWVARRA